ncbi:hypothetical protein WJX75_006214 [Coccomyxa subellipsoidea]|uniref:Uncharacterized protein n=1 Tax=Coccomyxa subellipsoidea TaxID=248742 RepID=A0ABR2Z411_9CHLO
MTNPVTTPAVTSGPPAWVEPGFLGGAQRAAANWVAAKVEPVPAQPPVQLAPALPRLQPAAMDPPKRHMDSTQRKKAKVAAMGSSVDLLLNRKAVLERELVDLLNRHEELSTDLPWHMQHEEVSFMASIASCMGPAAARQPPRTQPVQEPSPKLLQDLMLEPSATMTQLYKASGLFATKPLKENVVPSAATNGQNASPKQADKGAILWSSIVVFLRLSKAQKDGLAMAYSTHLAQVASLRGECLGIASKLQLMPQGEGLLKPNLATHLVCGQLSGIALHAEHLMQRLTEACCQVLNKVQLNNLRALAPAGASSFLALCQEVTASRAQSGKAAPTNSTTKGTTSSAPLSKPSKTRSGATGSGHPTAQAPANIALADASGSADIIANILQAAAVPGAAAAEGNTPARPAQASERLLARPRILRDSLPPCRVRVLRPCLGTVPSSL